MRVGCLPARFVLAMSLMAGGLIATPFPAAADFQQMKVREVFAGTTAQPNADFVELQMIAPGQGDVGGQFLHLYDPAGFRIDCHVPADVRNQSLNDRILFGTSEFRALPDPDPDFLLPHAVSGDAGAVCYGDIDCVSWGAFSSATTSPAGIPFPGGIPADMSIDRKAASDDTSMDTDDSSADFAPQTPDPQPNVTMPTPQGMACVAVDFIVANPSVRGLKAKVSGRRVIITGRLRPPAPDGRVALSLFANGSPLRKVAKKKDELNVDSRFKERFRAPAESSRCKVKVVFHGRAVGKKRFAC